MQSLTHFLINKHILQDQPPFHSPNKLPLRFICNLLVVLEEDYFKPAATRTVSRATVKKHLKHFSFSMNLGF